ncbi:ABC transporter substrate-binding protein [Labrys neptuniae]
MTGLTRRVLLRNSGLALLAGSFSAMDIGIGHAAKPVALVGWTFRPDMVQAYIDFFNKKYAEGVNYSTLPWPQFHQTLEQRFFAGDIVDVMYCFHSYRERWSQRGMIRSLDDLPGIDTIKSAMAPTSLANLQNKKGELIALPYFVNLYILMAAEPLLQKAGFQKPAGSWDELIEQCVKMKKDNISEHPYLPNWNPTVTGTTPQFLTDCFAEGISIFDAENKLNVDQDGVAKVMERWQKVYSLGLVTPEIFTKPSSTDTHRMMYTGNYAYHSNISNYLQTIDTNTKESLLAPKKAKLVPYPGSAGSTYSWTDSYVLNSKTEALDDAWKLMQFLGSNLNGDWYVQRQWALNSGLDCPYPALYDDAEIVASYANWVDLSVLREQYKKAKVIGAFKEDWYPEYDTQSVAILHDMIRGGRKVPDAIKALTDLYKSLA